MEREQRKQAALKLVNTAFIYAILAMVGGVFYREFTKFQGFSGRTTLGFVHTHLFLLGMLFFLAAALFELQVNVTGQSKFSLFYIIYQVGIAVTTIMLVVRGIVQVLGLELARGAEASISGISGIGHICVGAGIVLYFLMLKKALKE